MIHIGPTRTPKKMKTDDDKKDIVGTNLREFKKRREYGMTEQAHVDHPPLRDYEAVRHSIVANCPRLAEQIKEVGEH